MPIYEYRCESCGREFEVMQRITAPPVEVCEHCGAGPVHKLISQSTFILKGSGWYVTDYGKGSGRGNKESRKDDSTSSSGSGGSGKTASSSDKTTGTTSSSSSSTTT